MKRMILAGFVVALVTGAGMAEGDVIAERQQIMKGVGQAFYRDIGKMIKGQAPFDLAKAKASFVTIEAAAKKMPGLFPDTSKTGGETKALPKVWEDKAIFDKGFVSLQQNVAEAQNQTTDLVSLKTQFDIVNKNCSGCHENFRAKLD
jgi:cytochrome c556